MSQEHFDEGAPTTVSTGNRRKRGALPGLNTVRARGDLVERGRRLLDTALDKSATWGAGLLIGYAVAHVVWQFIVVDLVLQPFGIGFGHGWKTSISHSEVVAIALVGATLFYVFRGDPSLLKRFVVAGAGVWAVVAILK
jgi:hypothetical protein